jgi:hypothetical protein
MRRSRNNHREIWRSKGFGSFLFDLKRNRLWLRRLAFLWIIVVALEFFCPIFDCPDEYNFSAENLTSTSKFLRPNLPQSDLLSSLSIKSESFKKAFDSYKAADSQGDTGHMTTGNSVHCADECLCHAIAIPSLAFNISDRFNKPEFVRIADNDEPTLALSPPFEPPKSA